MDTLNIIFGIATLISLIITIAQYVSYSKTKANEIAKNEILKVKLIQMHNSLIPIHYSLSRVRNWIKESDDIDKYGLYRNLRTLEVQLEAQIIPIQQEIEKLKAWQHGAFTPSEFESPKQNKEVEGS